MQEQDLYFEPWLGDDYARQPYDMAATGRSGVYPMHILGESHYTADVDRSPQFTRDVIERYGWTPSRMPFFRNLIKTVTDNDEITPDVARAAWRNLAFSNYVQDFLPAPRVAPTSLMWERGHRAFAILLSRDTPDAILVLGQRLWNAMDKRDSFLLAPIEREDVILDDARVYERVDDKTGEKRWTLAAHILHPSAPRFDLRKARLRVSLLRQWMDNIDTAGVHLAHENQRDRISAK